MQLFFLAAMGLFGLSTAANAIDCDRLLVPDFALPSDTTTDLAYLAAVTPDNFAAHKANAFPKLAHVGIRLPMASHLLQYSKTYDEFSSGRAQKYTERGFNYPEPDLAAYYRRLLPAQRFSAYNACRRATGFAARIVEASRDVVQVVASWSPPQGGSAQAPITAFAVAGADLIGTSPASLQTQATFLFVRHRNADLRWSAKVDGEPVAFWVPRFIAAPYTPEPAAPVHCAEAAKVVRALFRQTLEREPKPAELAASTAMLKSGDNSVSQVATRIVLGEEYGKRFAQGKTLDDVLQGLYKHVFARPPSVKGLTSNRTQFRDAAFQTIALAFFEGGEYDRRFGEWNVPGDPPTISYCAAQK